MIERSTAYDNEFAAAVALEDIEEAKHGTLEWLHSPIKLTPLEKSRGMDGTKHNEKKYTRDVDYIGQGGAAEDCRKPAFIPGTWNDSFPRRAVEQPSFREGSFAREMPSSSVKGDLTADTAVARLPGLSNSIPYGSIIGRTQIGGGRPAPWNIISSLVSFNVIFYDEPTTNILVGLLDDNITEFFLLWFYNDLITNSFHDNIVWFTPQEDDVRDIRQAGGHVAMIRRRQGSEEVMSNTSHFPPFPKA